jgi:hypothetical protein
MAAEGGAMAAEVAMNAAAIAAALVIAAEV